MTQRLENPYHTGGDGIDAFFEDGSERLGEFLYTLQQEGHSNADLICMLEAEIEQLKSVDPS